MLKSVILGLTALMALTMGAAAGDRYGNAPPAARYYGPVSNYYGPVTIYAAPDGGYPAPAPDASAYGYGTAPGWDANSYGAGYDWSHGYGYDDPYGAGGYAYPAYGYGYGYYGYPPANEAQRQDPWAGYNGGFGNGYW